MTTVDGTLTGVPCFAANEMEIPVLGAAFAMVTVPVELTPPVTVDGLNVTPVTL